jgi:hypothetical protein
MAAVPSHKIALVLSGGVSAGAYPLEELLSTGFLHIW